MARVAVTRRLPGDALDRLAGRARRRGLARRPAARAGGAARAGRGRRGPALPAHRARRRRRCSTPRRGLRAIANYAVGSDNIDLAATAARGIAVGVTPGRPDRRHRRPRVRTAARRRAAASPRPRAAVREGAGARGSPQGWLGLEVDGATLAVVGPGRIGAGGGRAGARLRHGRSMRVGRDDDLHAALARPTSSTLHAPLTAATRHLIDDAALRAMRAAARSSSTPRRGGARRPGRAAPRAAGGPARRGRARRHRSRAAAARRPAARRAEPARRPAHRLGHAHRARSAWPTSPSTTCSPALDGRADALPGGA